MTAAEEEQDPRPGRDDLGMMRRADLWPRWPHLPVKGNIQQGARRIGFLIEVGDTKAAKPTVYSYDTNAPIAEYPTLEDLVADGWVVD